MTRKKYRPQRDDAMLGDSEPVSGTGSESGTAQPVPVPAPVPVPVSHSDDEGNVIVDVGNHNHFIPVVICELEESSIENVPEPVSELEIPPSCASDAPCSGCAEVAETSNVHSVPAVSAIVNTNDGVGADASADAEVGSKTDAEVGSKTDAEVGSKNDAVVAKVVDGIVDNVVLASASAPPPSSKWSWARVKNWVSGCCAFCCCCRRKRRTSVQLK